MLMKIWRKGSRSAYSWWECRLVQPLWKTMEFSQGSCLLTQQFHFLEYTLVILKHQFKRTYAPLPMFTAELFTIVKC